MPLGILSDLVASRSILPSGIDYAGSVKKPGTHVTGPPALLPTETGLMQLHLRAHLMV